MNSDWWGPFKSSDRVLHRTFSTFGQVWNWYGPSCSPNSELNSGVKVIRRWKVGLESWNPVSGFRTEKRRLYVVVFRETAGFVDRRRKDEAFMFHFKQKAQPRSWWVMEAFEKVTCDEITSHKTPPESIRVHTRAFRLKRSGFHRYDQTGSGKCQL